MIEIINHRAGWDEVVMKMIDIINYKAGWDEVV